MKKNTNDFRLDLIKNEKEGTLECILNPKDRIIVFYDSFKKGTSVLLYSGTALRKVTILNITNESEAIRDALGSVSGFVKTSLGLSMAANSFQNKLWPTLDGEVLVPTFENVEIERLNLSQRSENALDKNKITVLRELPQKLDEIAKLRGVGEASAKEIFAQRQKFLASVGIDNKETITTTAIVKNSPFKSASKLIIDSNIPKNLQEILLGNALAFLDDIPRDISKILKLKKMGPSKARQLLDILES